MRTAIKISILLSWSVAWLCSGSLFANNVRISSLDLNEDGSLILELNWDHGWHHIDDERDGVWVFLKEQVAGEWQHLPVRRVLYRSGNAEIQSVDVDGTGFMVVAREGETGNIGIQVEIELEKRGNQMAIDAHAIEMIWVPEVSFFVGDGASNHRLGTGNNFVPFLVDSEQEIATGSGANTLNSADDYPPAANIPAHYPKGYAGFWCMKYEISQGQYTAFLNSLSLEQQIARTVTDPRSSAGTHTFSTTNPNRNGITLSIPATATAPANYTCATPDRACNFFRGDDLLAYLDWAGLAPLTELEYEKAARGPLAPQALEYAWGSPEVLDANTVTDDGTSTESVSETVSGSVGLASHGYDGPQGPLRTGFAAGENTDRYAAGASYYGVFELSGNLWELCVSLNEDALQYDGHNGDGTLDATGSANESNWPTENGIGFRGGGWNSGILPGFRDLAVSDRFYAGLPANSRRNTSGGRGVRR